MCSGAAMFMDYLDQLDGYELEANYRVDNVGSALAGGSLSLRSAQRYFKLEVDYDYRVNNADLAWVEGPPPLCLVPSWVCRVLGLAQRYFKLELADDYSVDNTSLVSVGGPLCLRGWGTLMFITEVFQTRSRSPRRYR